ncbi:PP2C family protein-serine/threonine phosphatase [Flavobacterium gawalongense]|nr:PP2C family protein-serine/threonine phosphatase [Flavobacterium gawalongense]
MLYSFSNKGKRKSNQDYLISKLINPECSLHIVVDGMGGYEYGEMASKLVAENIYTYLSTVKEINEKEIQKAVNKSNLIIKQKSDDFGAKIGATLAGVIIIHNVAYLFWVGDVKIIFIRDNEIIFESHSHTLINQMIDNGNVINRIERYKHIVTRSVSGNIKDGMISFEFIPNLIDDDLFIICSDGVSDVINSYQINNLIKTVASKQEAISQIEGLCSLESRDNFSMIMVQNH